MCHLLLCPSFVTFPEGYLLFCTSFVTFPERIHGLMPRLVNNIFIFAARKQDQVLQQIRPHLRTGSKNSACCRNQSDFMINRIPNILYGSVCQWPFFFLQEEKKKFDKQTEKYCLVVQNYLNLSSKKKDSILSEVRCFTHLWIIYSYLFYF